MRCRAACDSSSTPSRSVEITRSCAGRTGGHAGDRGCSAYIREHGAATARFASALGSSRACRSAARILDPHLCHLEHGYNRALRH